MLIFWRQPSLKDFGSHMINNIQSKLVTMCYIDVTLGIKASLGSHGCLVMMVGQLKIYVTYVSPRVLWGFNCIYKNRGIAQNVRNRIVMDAAFNK